MLCFTKGYWVKLIIGLITNLLHHVAHLQMAKISGAIDSAPFVRNLEICWRTQPSTVSTQLCG